MKKIICKREYDTEVASLIKKFTVGEFGDSKGYEESLYEMPDGKLLTAERSLFIPPKTSRASQKKRQRLGLKTTNNSLL